MTKTRVGLVAIALAGALLAGCGGGDDTASTRAVGADGSPRPSSLGDVAGKDGRLTEITEAPGTGPLLGLEEGKEVRVGDVASFCTNYAIVAAYRDELQRLVAAGDASGARDHVEAKVREVEAAASKTHIAISGDRDLGMTPFTFVVGTEKWLYEDRSDDAEAMAERLAFSVERLAPFDAALTEAC